jgi:hypothetical protein
MYIHIDDIIYYDTESHSILRGLLPEILRKFGYAERLCTDRTILARTMATYLTICGHFPCIIDICCALMPFAASAGRQDRPHK